MVRFITLGFLVVGSSTNIVEKIKPPNLFQKKRGAIAPTLIFYLD
jgi:hypothetical protein